MPEYICGCLVGASDRDSAGAPFSVVEVDQEDCGNGKNPRLTTDIDLQRSNKLVRHG